MDAQWEYKVIHVPANQWTGTGLPADLNQYIDRLGADGWELVATEAIVRPRWFVAGANTVAILGFFKRGRGGSRGRLVAGPDEKRA